MEHRRLGRSELRFAPLMFGGNVFGWTADEAMSHKLLDAFVDAGFNAIDTADVYSTWVEGHQGGESEAIIGSWLKKRGGRDKVIIATKVGSDMGGGKKGLAPAYIRQAVEASLRRLQTDYIDLYQSHRDDETVAQAETMAVYADLVQAGKVRVIGASNFSAKRMASAEKAVAKGGPRYESLQPCYNLYDRSEYEGAVQDFCVREEIGVISYFSLASGFLTGKYRSKQDIGQSARGEDVEKYFDTRGTNILAALDQVAARYQVKPAQVALAWLLAQPGITAPIASATSLSQLETLTGAARLKLDADAVKQLTDAGN
ncbi:MAG TPA: aldo/keto reductase [Terriglobales bacterium]|nr:aldo/keto reductase [Terriglobales bacterium]